MNFTIEENEIYYIENGQKLARICFIFEDNNVALINHTFVDDSLKGQGIASKLVRMCYDVMKEKNMKIKATCSYAKMWFNKHPECKDIYVE